MRRGEKPVLHYKNKGSDANYMVEIIRRTPTLQDVYTPPPVWGYSGHMQTALFGLMTTRPGLPTSTLPTKRHSLVLNDHSTITYDEYLEPTNLAPVPDVSILICPGLANSSENAYIRAFAINAMSKGFRVMALNPLGVLPDVPLTSPRVFNFGSTDEYEAMVKDVLLHYPDTKLIAVGFSLGANIVCKYLGEKVENQIPFLTCLSLCQGYDFVRMQELMNTWKKMRKFYVRRMTDKMKQVILNHEQTLFAEEHHHLYDKQITTKDISRCEFLPQLDDLISRHLTGHCGIEEYYTWASSSNYIPNLQIPCLFLNASDDPLFSKKLFTTPMTHATNNPRTMFVVTRHGGHLGFYEKTGKARVNRHTWLERSMIEYIEATVSVELGLHWKPDLLKQDKTIPRSITEPAWPSTVIVENEAESSNKQSERYTDEENNDTKSLSINDVTVDTRNSNKFPFIFYETSV